MGKQFLKLLATIKIEKEVFIQRGQLINQKILVRINFFLQERTLLHGKMHFLETAIVTLLR